LHLDGSVSVALRERAAQPTGGGNGFDIPADTVKSVVVQLKGSGHVTRGWMGVQIQAVTADIADSLGLKKAEGALVSEAQNDSPAAKAGIMAGDVITTLDGAAVKDSRGAQDRRDDTRHLGQARRHAQWQREDRDARPRHLAR
jgi:S1-C subfamily serine protease